MNNFAFDVPFCDFTQFPTNEVQNAEAFFDVEHDNHNGVLIGEPKIDGILNMDIEEQFYSVSPQDVKLRRSISVGQLDLVKLLPTNDIENIEKDLKNMKYRTPKRSTQHNNCSLAMSLKTHEMITRADVNNLTNRIKTMSMEGLNKINHNKPQPSSNTYVSMAEAINKYLQKTPIRFHSRSRVHVNNPVKPNGPTLATIAKSPALKTKTRVRSVSVMSREEHEAKELEEAKKHVIKANPVNKKILKGPIPLKTTVVKKPPTEQAPFKLTEVTVKKSTPSIVPRPSQFHARPVPKSVFAAPQPIIKSNLHTITKTPSFMKNKMQKPDESMVDGKGKKPEGGKLVLTKPVPFSFEQRDKELMKKRDQLVLEVFKEEQKAREFHANPIPKKFLQSMHDKNTTISHINNSGFYKTNDNMSDTFTFKARPATVLHTKPFLPRRDERTLTEISEFKLNTEHRAKERFEYEQRKKEKEEEKLLLIQQDADLKLQQELEEVARLRKAAEIKANPIRRYKDIKPVPSKKLVSPKSPKLTTDRTRNKEN